MKRAIMVGRRLLVPRPAVALAVFLALTARAAAQTPGNAMPATSRTRASVHDSLTTSYEVSGVRIIHRLTPANDIVAANVYLLGGVRQIVRGSVGYAGSRGDWRPDVMLVCADHLAAS